MSSKQKTLKIVSLLSLVGALDLIITLIVLAVGGDAPDPLMIAMMCVVAVCALVLGVMGALAANVPARAAKMLPVIILSLFANAADVVLAMKFGVAVVSICINALICVGVAYSAHVVNKEHLQI